MTEGSPGQDHANPHGLLSARPSGSRFSFRSQIYVALLWFAFSAQWTTLLSVIIPDQVANIVGPDSPQKEGLSGTVLAAGAVIALFVAPLAGALSDRARSPRGRRRPFLIAGVVGSCIGLMLMAPFRPGSSLLIYTIAFLNLTFWWNWLAGAYAGLIPDVVPERDQGLASAWINIMTAIGTGLGNFLVAILYAPNHPTTVLAAFAAVSLACLILTLKHVKEPPSAGADDKFAIMPFLRSFVIDPRAHPNFYWVLVTRLFVNMGVWSISAMLLFYAQDVIGLAHAANSLPALLGVGAFLSIPASLIAVWLSARHGLILIVQITSWIMVAATVMLRPDSIPAAFPLVCSDRAALLAGLGRLPGGRLGAGPESSSQHRRRREGHGHLAYRLRVAPDHRARRHRLADLEVCGSLSQPAPPIWAHSASRRCGSSSRPCSSCGFACGPRHEIHHICAPSLLPAAPRLAGRRFMVRFPPRADTSRLQDSMKLSTAELQSGAMNAENLRIAVRTSEGVRLCRH